MSISGAARKAKSHHSQPSNINRDVRETTPRETLTAELQDALVRERALLREKSDLLQRQNTLAQEFEHRLANSLQLVTSLLSLQGRAATTPEAAEQLDIAARRVAAIGRVHCRLHIPDRQEKVELKKYLQGLCNDLAILLFHEPTNRAIIIQSTNIEIPTTLGIPLGFIVNELITNSTKYSQGNVTVRFETLTSADYSLSVLDEGPGLPAGFDPANSKGLGMKIVLSLVKQIGGELHILPGDNGHGARFAITFRSSN
jgi:two-component system, sensor histidine kinase PdtaS